MRDSKIESFCEVLSYGFMLCCQIMYEMGCYTSLT